MIERNLRRKMLARIVFQRRKENRRNKHIEEELRRKRTSKHDSPCMEFDAAKKAKTTCSASYSDIQIKKTTTTTHTHILEKNSFALYLYRKNEEKKFR